MAKWIVGVVHVHAIGGENTHASHEQAPSPDGSEAVQVVVAVVALETKAITWHLLAPLVVAADVVEQLDILLDDLSWANPYIQCDDVEIIVLDSSEDCPVDWIPHLQRFASTRNHQIVIVHQNELLADHQKEESMEEALCMLWNPSATQVFNKAQHRGVQPAVFACGVKNLYGILQRHSDVLRDPKLEHGFQLAIEAYEKPLRQYMRCTLNSPLGGKTHAALNDAAKHAFLSPAQHGECSSSSTSSSPSIYTLSRRRCRTKRGRRLLRDVPPAETRGGSIGDRTTPGYSQRTRTTRQGGYKVTRANEQPVMFIYTPATTSSGVAGLCGGRRGDPTGVVLQRYCFYKNMSTIITGSYEAFTQTTTPALCQTFYFPQTSPLQQYSNDTLTKLDAFSPLDDEPKTPSDVTSLRLQIQSGEQAIHRHRDEMGVQLLLPRDRIKIVFEDAVDSFSTPTLASTQPVLFRVTRQDGHRIFQASSRAIKTIKTIKAAASLLLPRLVYSRRTTGVWFSTPQLDTLAAQWRAYRHALHRLESQLVQSLANDFNTSVRPVLAHLMSNTAELDLLAAFAQVSLQYQYTRPTTTTVATSSDDGAMEMEIVGLRGLTSHSEPGCSTETTTLRLDAHQMLAVHSAIDASSADLLWQIGNVVVLHQIGCFVPCSFAKLPILDSLFLRSGASDSPLANASTFLTEMQELSETMALATTRAKKKSLVLVHELCRGTAPQEGLPLAVEICKFLIQEKNVLLCLSTQWTELLTELLLQLQDRISVPLLEPDASMDRNKWLYTQRQHQLDHHFIEKLHEFEFPEELVASIQQELEEDSSNSTTALE